MLFLLFKLGHDRYALDSAQVLEVLPLLDLKQINPVLRGLAGMFNYHGQFVSAVDLCELILQRPAQKRLSTRIIVIKHPDPAHAGRLLGLIAEEATGFLRAERNQFSTPTRDLPGSAQTNPTFFDAQGAIHLLDERQLLSQTLVDQLANDSD